MVVHGECRWGEENGENGEMREIRGPRGALNFFC